MNIQNATPFGVAFFVGGCYEDQRRDSLDMNSFAEQIPRVLVPSWHH
jgi:hypothetical protein